MSDVTRISEHRLVVALDDDKWNRGIEAGRALQRSNKEITRVRRFYPANAREVAVLEQLGSNMYGRLRVRYVWLRNEGASIEQALATIAGSPS